MGRYNVWMIRLHRCGEKQASFRGWVKAVVAEVTQGMTLLETEWQQVPRLVRDPMSIREIMDFEVGSGLLRNARVDLEFAERFGSLES